jgi:hypothetical protein
MSYITIVETPKIAIGAGLVVDLRYSGNGRAVKTITLVTVTLRSTLVASLITTTLVTTSDLLLPLYGLLY